MLLNTALAGRPAVIGVQVTPSSAERYWAHWPEMRMMCEPGQVAILDSCVPLSNRRGITDHVLPPSVEDAMPPVTEANSLPLIPGCARIEYTPKEPGETCLSASRLVSEILEPPLAM